MKLSRCLMTIGIIVAVAMLQVAQRNSVYLKGYSLGERVSQAHKEQAEVSWLETKVLKLTSPDNLSDAAEERHLKLVAWSMLTAEQVALLADTAEPISNSAITLADGRDTTD